MCHLEWLLIPVLASKYQKKKLIPDTLLDFFLLSKENNFFFEIFKLFDFCVYIEMRDRKSGKEKQ